MDHTHPFNTAALFEPGRLGPYTLPHRLLMAPMTRNRARRDGVPSPSAVIYYAQRASAAMIVTETTTVSEQAVGYPLMPGIHTADQVAGWRPVVDAVHRFGCRFFLQLFHAGRVSHPSRWAEAYAAGRNTSIDVLLNDIDWVLQRRSAEES